MCMRGLDEAGTVCALRSLKHIKIIICTKEAEMTVRSAFSVAFFFYLQLSCSCTLEHTGILAFFLMSVAQRHPFDPEHPFESMRENKGTMLMH